MAYEILQIIGLFFLLILSGFFSGSETAILSISKAKVRHLADDGDKRAKTLYELLDDPHKLLSTLLICNNFVNIAASAIATSLAIEFFNSYGVAFATGGMTLLILTFGEITPKRVAIRRAERISLMVAGPIESLSFVLYPISRVLNFLTDPIIKLSGGDDRENTLVTEEEIKTLVDVGEKEGVFEEAEREMIHRVFELGDTVVRELMTARTDMICLEVKQSMEECLDIITSHGYSRIPVFEEKIDNIVGVIYAKDLLQHLWKGGDSQLESIMRTPYFVPETKLVNELLKEFQKGEIHMAIIIDEYGGTSGLLTIEDIIEEIVGNIFDEYDAGEEEVKIIDENTFIIDSRMHIDELAQLMKCDIPEGDFDTAGGFVFDLFDRVPEQGEKIKFENHEISIEKIDKRRMKKIRVKKIKPKGHYYNPEEPEVKEL
ncbi:MAG: hemolysin family protein [Halobacteriota archaeon]|nr:hemolysin family protein [Halobacteriota archaeon]